MTAAISAKGRAVLDEFWQRIKGEPSGLVDEWKAMTEAERLFWLRASRLSPTWAKHPDWLAIPGDIRTTLKNNLYRAAKRAQTILGLPA
jgi:hypothetical protein